MALCIDVMQATKVAFPKHRFNIDDDLLKGVMKKQYILDETGAADFHNFLSRLYFEAHKATELWQEEKESA
jgi:hypothetical protein